MKIFSGLFISLIILFGLKQHALAENSVSVSSNTSGESNTHVQVNSNVQSASNTTVTSSSKTQIHIETNGEVKDFSTEGNESVDWESDDGKSSVKINAHSKTTPKPTDREDDDDSPSVTPTESSHSAQKSHDDKKTPQGFNFSEFFHKLFSLFGFTK